MIRPDPNGPRSSITTVTERPVSRSVTVTWVPNGSHGCAAVRPLHGGSYHEASPVSVVAPVPGSRSTPSVMEYGADSRTSGTGGGRPPRDTVRRAGARALTIGPAAPPRPPPGEPGGNTPQWPRGRPDAECGSPGALVGSA